MRFLYFAIFFASFLIFNSNFSYLPGGDSVPNRYMPFSIICEGNFELSEFPNLYMLNGKESLPYYLTKGTGGEVVSTFGIGAPLFSVPFYLIAIIFTREFSYDETLALSKAVASTVSAFGVLLFFMTLMLFTGKRDALIGTVIYSFGTLVFSICSQGIYQHTHAVFFLTAGLYYFLRGLKESGKPYPVSALFFALAVFVRPQCGVFYALFFILTALKYRNILVKFVVYSYPVFLVIAAYNSYYFDSPFSFSQLERSREIALYKTGSATLFGFNLEGLAGVLFSPSRGLFVFSPIFLLMPYSLYHLFREGGNSIKPFLYTGLIASLLYIFLMSSWFDWWGGWTFGYRQVIEVIPFFSLFLGMTIEKLFAKKTIKALPGVLIVASIFIQFIGVHIYDIYGWNESKNVDRNPAVLWSVRESQIVYYLENFKIRDYTGYYDVRNPQAIEVCN